MMNTAKNYHRIVLFFVTLSVLLAVCVVPAAAERSLFQKNDGVVDLYFFHGDGCPHCAEEEVFLDEMKQTYGEKLAIHMYEVWKHPENIPVIEKFAQAFLFEPSGVPVTFIGRQYWVGYSPEKRDAMKAAIEDGIAHGMVDAQDIADGKVSLEALQTDQITTIQVPLIGTVDLASRSLFVSTVLIGLVDGINPCSLWVLTMLLAMLVHLNSRKKTILIGLIFLTVTAGIYALFITGVFTLLTYVSFLKWIQIVVAVITLILGLINLKDYFFYKEGISLTIQDSQKPGIYQKMRKVMSSSENLWAMIGATVVLAAGVSLVEFSCTAAFPVVWGNLLVAHGASRMEFAVLLLLYMLLYQLDEMIIFLAAVITMKTSRIEEKHGRILKLFSGCLMITLSAVMILSPEWMQNLGNTLLVFGFAVAITLLIFLLTKNILPGMDDKTHKRSTKGNSSKKTRK